MAELIAATQPAFLSEWNFVATITAPPTTAQVRLNANNQKNATRLWLHIYTANGIDASFRLAVIKIGDVISLHDNGDATKWNSYTVTGTPIKQVDFFEYPVIWLAGGVNPMTAARVTVDTPFVDLEYLVKPLPALSIDAGLAHISGQLMDYTHAYPFEGRYYTSPGLTKREYYASMAMQGFISAAPAANLIGKVADYCFQVADSMIAAEARVAAGEPGNIAGQEKGQITVNQLRAEQAAAVTLQARRAS